MRREPTMSPPAKITWRNSSGWSELLEILREGANYLNPARPGNGPIARRRVRPIKHQPLSDWTAMPRGICETREVHQRLPRDLKIETEAASFSEIRFHLRYHC